MTFQYNYNEIKGIANSEITCEFMFNVGRAVAYVVSRSFQGAPKVLIGKDTRISGDMLESALASGLTSMGANVVLLGVSSGAAVSYLTKTYEAQAGIVISASADNFKYNGFKIYSDRCTRLYEVEKDVMSVIENNWVLDMPASDKLGKIYIKHDSLYDYIAYAKSSITTDLKGIKIAVDCANGVYSYIAPKIFEDFGATVFAVNNTPDGVNINNDCGVNNLEKLSEVVKSHDADIGIAFDGEGSFVLLTDENGIEIEGDKIIAVCCKDMFNKGKLKDNTVVTSFVNTGFKKFAVENNLNLIETFGDNYSFESILQDNSYSVGGNKEGYIVLPEYNYVSDGLITALQFLSILKNSNKTVSMLVDDIGFLPSVTAEAIVKSENTNEYINDALIMSEVERLNNEFSGNGRVIIKPYYDKSAIKVIIDGEDLEYISERANEICKLLELKYN